MAHRGPRRPDADARTARWQPGDRRRRQFRIEQRPARPVPTVDFDAYPNAGDFSDIGAFEYQDVIFKDTFDE